MNLMRIGQRHLDVVDRLYAQIHRPYVAVIVSLADAKVLLELAGILYFMASPEYDTRDQVHQRDKSTAIEGE